MNTKEVTMSVRKANERASIIDIGGEVTSSAESLLMDAYQEANFDKTDAIILNFSNLEYLNSSGIGLLVTLLIRVQRNKQRLFSYGLNEHYQQIFELTRLNEAISIFENEEAALAALTM